jgi:N6-adenosine-specific RNA methylase IME4
VKDLPSGPFTTVVADPPWPYGDALPGPGRGAKKHYVLMSLDDISMMGIQLQDSVADDAHLYLWTTNSFIAESWQIAKDWGFEPKSVITWAKAKDLSNGASNKLVVGEDPKLQFGMGHYARNCTEHAIFAVRGKLAVLNHNVPGILFAPRRKHSEKPDEFYSMVERLSSGPYLELFARRPWKGWAAWGNEVDWQQEPESRKKIKHTSATRAIRQTEKDYSGRDPDDD